MSGAACMAELQRRLAAEGPASDSEAVTAPAASPAAPHRLARLRELLRRSDTPSPRDSSGPLQDLLADESESLLLADIDVDASSMHDLAVLRSVAVRDCLADEDRPDSRLFLEPVRLAEGAGSAAAGDAPAPADGRCSPRAELQLEARQISSMRSITVLATAWLLASAALAQTGGSRIPSFEAIALTGEAVSSATLVGQPTLLIVTPSEGAAADTRMWVQGLGEHIDPKAIRIRAVLAVDVPFYMSEADVIGRTKERIPQRYYDQTWITSGKQLEQALNIPVASDKAFVLVLDTQGTVVVRVAGEPTEQRMRVVQGAVRSLVR